MLGYAARQAAIAPLRVLEAARYDRRVRAHALAQPPIFVLGHWRSGTTFLQSLLALDPHLTTSNLYQSLFPDVFLLTEARCKPWLNRLGRALGIDYPIQRSTLDFEVPAEADVALCMLGSQYAYSWGHLYPRQFERWLSRQILHATPEATQGWLAHLDYFIRKLSFASGGKRVVIKSPGDIGRIPALLEQYPGAQFVYVERDPIAVFHSNLYLWKVIDEAIALQGLDRAEIEAMIVRSYRSLMRRCAEQRALIPAGQLAELRFERLRADPVGELSRVYAELQLGELQRPAIEAFAAAQSDYRSPQYESSPELLERLRRAWEPD